MTLIREICKKMAPEPLENLKVDKVEESDGRSQEFDIHPHANYPTKLDHKSL